MYFRFVDMVSQSSVPMLSLLMTMKPFVRFMQSMTLRKRPSQRFVSLTNIKIYAIPASLINQTLFLQGVLHWVAESSPGKEPIKVEVRLFEKLLNSEVFL